MDTKGTKIRINIQINQQHYQVDVGEMTGAELKALAGIPEGNLLFREVHGPGGRRADSERHCGAAAQR